MVEIRHSLKGKCEAIGISSFKNDDKTETTAVHLNFMNLDKNGNLEIVKVKVKDATDIKQLEQCRNKVLFIDVDLFVMNNKKYYSCETKNIQIMKEEK